jgi:hypothetical protein
MNAGNTPRTNNLLGYPADARLLFINADDFGMCHAVNEAIIRTLEEGIVGSTSMMVPCPWALHALTWLQEAPDVPFGVHLTSVSEQPAHRWGPITCRAEVPSLVDKTGSFYPESRIDEFLDQVELLLRGRRKAQIAARLRSAGSVRRTVLAVVSCCRTGDYYDHHRPSSEPARITANSRSICTASTSGASAPLPRAMIATESIPPGVVAR